MEIVPLMLPLGMYTKRFRVQNHFTVTSLDLRSSQLSPLAAACNDSHAATWVESFHDFWSVGDGQHTQNLSQNLFLEGLIDYILKSSTSFLPQIFMNQDR